VGIFCFYNISDARFYNFVAMEIFHPTALIEIQNIL